MSELFIGVDVGGTAVKLGICGKDGRVRARGTVATDPSAEPSVMFQQIGDAARTLMKQAGDARSCGVGTPGPLDPERRVLNRANHLPRWKDVTIPNIVGERRSTGRQTS